MQAQSRMAHTVKRPVKLVHSIKRRVFTFIEVMVVVMIIAAMFALTVTQMDNFIPSYQLKKHVHETANLLELAFSQAAIDGREIALYIDLNKRHTRLEYLPEEEEEGVEFDLPLGGDETEEEEPIFIGDWPEDINLEKFEVKTFEKEDDRDFIIFSPFGHCDGAEFVWRNDDSGLSQKIELWSLIGKIVVHPLNDENSF